MEEITKIEREYKSILCKICNTVKLAFFDGYFGDGKSKRWIDEDGLLFNGKICPICQVHKTRENMRKLRHRNER